MVDTRPAAPRRSRRAALGGALPAGLVGIAILSLLTGSAARALDLTGGPTQSPPGGASCSASDVDPNGTALTLNCTVSTPGAFADLYFGLANNATANGIEMDGTLPSGNEIFRYSSSTPRSITYTSMTTINNVLGSATENVNSRLVLTLAAGTGTVMDTGGTPANNDQGDIQKLFRIAGDTFSVRVEVTSNTLPIPTFGLSNTAVYNQTHTPQDTGSSTILNLGFYYKQCTP